jgi:hypothetical protein
MISKYGVERIWKEEIGAYNYNTNYKGFYRLLFAFMTCYSAYTHTSSNVSGCYVKTEFLTSTVRSRLRYVKHMSSTGKINACSRAGQHLALKESICGPWSPE